MKKKIVILGSTGSIGETTINIIKNNKKDFEVMLLTTNNNIDKMLTNIIKIIGPEPEWKKFAKTIADNIKYTRLNLPDSFSKLFTKRKQYSGIKI